MERKIIEVKAWVIDKAQEAASWYHCFIDYAERDERLGCRIERDGFIKVYQEDLLAETEKAVKVRLQTGFIDGSFKGWTLWIPKSCIR